MPTTSGEIGFQQTGKGDTVVCISAHSRFILRRKNDMISQMTTSAYRHIVKTTPWLLAVGMVFLLSACGEDLPFAADYTSRNRVVVTYQGKQYTLERYGIPAQAPFTYRFEDDGDLDLTIDGRTYEVDSPYDRDKKKKTTSKKSKKKTSRTASKKSKRR